MAFESRVFQLAKDTAHPDQCQDAFALDPARGIAVVADGVASAIFSRRWAGILVEATVAEPPDPNDEAAFARWLKRQRQTWSEQIDVGSLAWFQKAKLAAGAFSTLLWVSLQPAGQPPAAESGCYRMQSFAIGDSCLFHVRAGEVLRTFPVETSQQFETDPIVLGSADRGRDRLMEFVSYDDVCHAGDLLVLCSDAVADWALRGIESGSPPAWDDYWNMSEESWQDEIVALRNQRQMRYDDTTLILLRLADHGTESPSQPQRHVRAEAVEDEPQTEATQKQAADEPSGISEEDWKEKLKSASGQFAEGIELASNQALRGLKTWREKVARRLRDKFGQDDETPPRES